MLLERVPEAGICRVLEINKKTLRKYIDIIFSTLPDDLNVDLSFNKIYKVKKHKIVISRSRLEIDEMWTFAGSKNNQVWIWIAYNPDTDEIVAFHCGDRNEKSGRILWDNIPDEIKNISLIFTDKCASYNFIPADRHIRVKGGNRVTNHVERINCTLRQRCSRLVRKSLSFSKKAENLSSLLKYFFCCYNTRCIT